MRCAPETSPKRRAAVKIYYENRDLAQRLNPSYNFSECTCALELWDATGMVRLVWYNRDEGAWMWALAAARTCGVKTPHCIDVDPASTLTAEQGEDVAQEEAAGELEDDEMKEDKENERPNEQGTKRNAEDKTEKPAEKQQKVFQRNTTL